MFSIIEADGKWLVMAGDQVLAVRDGKDAAIAALAEQLATSPPETTSEALLPEVWRGPLSRSAATGDGRDFTDVEWSWRDPAVSRLPLMNQVQTDIGHFNARLAGYITRIWLDGSTPMGEGRFFDSEDGRAARDVVAGAGRWGVSVDPGEVDWEEECLEWDEEAGWCTSALVRFLKYQIIGLTLTPFPAFADAWIELTATADGEGDDSGDATDDAGDAESEAAVTEATTTAAVIASGKRPPVPVEFFSAPLLDRLRGAPHINIEEPDEAGWRETWGWVATFDQCHIGYRGVCVTAPDAIDVNRFRAGTVRTTAGDVATGPLVFGTDHLDDLYATPQAAIDHLSHTGLAWADVVVGVNDLGIWYHGVVRPGIDDDQVHVLRGSANSGDWREVDGVVKLVACLAVNGPGFEVERAIVASGRHVPVEQRPMRVAMRNGQLVAGLGLGSRRVCADCSRRASAEAHAAADLAAVAGRLSSIERVLALIESRSRALVPARASQLRSRLAASHGIGSEPSVHRSE